MRKTIVILTIALGGMALLGGALLGLLIGLMAALSSKARPDQGIQLLAIALALASGGIACGLTLLWAGVGAYRNASSQRFVMPAWGWWLLAWFLALGLGQWALSSGMSLLGPFFHLAAGSLPALLCLSLALGAVRKQAQGPSTRAMLASFGWGGAGATSLGVLIETGIAGAGLLVLLLILRATEPSLIDRLQKLILEAGQSGRPLDLSSLEPLLSAPVFIVGVLGLVAVVVPVIEETAKALSVPLFVLAGRQPTRVDGFLLGVAGGAGFAFLEGMLNGSLALASPSAWGGLMLMRGAAAAMHCVASGLMGLGWQAILIEKRWGRAIALALTSAALHGLWNLAAGAQVLIALRVGERPGLAFVGLALAGCVALLGIFAVAALVLLPRRLLASSGLPS